MRRFGAFYLPNGMSMASWTPTGEGSAFAFSEIMEPLTPFRDRLVVLSGMCSKEADPLPGEGDGDHSRAQAGFLTGAHAKKTGSGADLEAGISLDQIAAKEFGKETQLASLELALESYDLVGQCEDGYGCAYSATIAWRNAKTPLPMEADPRAVFERLFGVSDSTDRQSRLVRFGGIAAFSTWSPGSWATSSGSWVRGTARGSRSMSTRSAMSSGGSRSRSSRATGSCRRSTSRRACPRVLKRTRRSCTTCSRCRGRPI